MKEYLTANDLMVIDKFLDERGRVSYPNDTKFIKDLLISKRIKIAKILENIKIEVKEVK